MEYLIYSAVLGLVSLLVADVAATMQRGLAYNISSRDETKPPLQGAAGRLDRAFKNYLETFPILAASALAVMALGKNSPLLDQGLMLYFWARVAYLPIYGAGVPIARSVAWGASLVGIGMVIAAGLS